VRQRGLKQRRVAETVPELPRRPFSRVEQGLPSLRD
jgi:hypothetical protein